MFLFVYVADTYLVCVACVLHHVRGERAADGSNPAQHCVHRVVVEEHVPCQQLRQDGAERPDVNGLSVRQAQDDLRCTVAPALHIGAEVVVCEAGGTEVDDLDLAAAEAADEDVLGLQVAVYEVQLVDEGERCQDLLWWCGMSIARKE